MHALVLEEVFYIITLYYAAALSILNTLLYCVIIIIMSGHLILHPKNHLCEHISLSCPADVRLRVHTHMRTFIHVCIDGVLTGLFLSLIFTFQHATANFFL